MVQTKIEQWHVKREGRLQQGSTAPVFSIDPVDLAKDPYPQLAQLQREAPIAWVPQLGATLITRFDDIDICEKNIAIFSSDQPTGPMTRLMGRNMMRKDGKEHRAERKAVMPSFSQRAVKEFWNTRIEQLVCVEVERCATELALGPTDLVAGFATRVSGQVLREVTGLVQLTPEDMDWASQSMINGVANLDGNPAVEAECQRATVFLDQAIDDVVKTPLTLPEASMCRMLSLSKAPLEMIQNNVKLAISGGQNETRDVLAGCIWAVLNFGFHPTTLSWNRVFDEYVRWMAPIGMSPRRVAQDFDYHGIRFSEGSVVRLMFGIANRDPSRFGADADQFQPDFDRPQHMAFGAGPHFCAGAFVSRMTIAGQALPQFFDRFRDICLWGETHFDGWAFRGPKSVSVRHI